MAFLWVISHLFLWALDRSLLSGWQDEFWYFFKHSFGSHLFSVFINLGEVIHISEISELLDHSLNVLFFFTCFVHYLFFISFKFKNTSILSSNPHIIFFWWYAMFEDYYWYIIVTFQRLIFSQLNYLISLRISIIPFIFFPLSNPHLFFKGNILKGDGFLFHF